jgi:hypothetical protein
LLRELRALSGREWLDPARGVCADQEQMHKKLAEEMEVDEHLRYVPSPPANLSRRRRRAKAAEAVKKLRIGPYGSGGRDRSRGRFVTPAGFPLQNCSPYKRLHVRCESAGVVHRSRRIFCRPVPNLSLSLVDKTPLRVDTCVLTLKTTRGEGGGGGGRGVLVQS